MGLTYAQVIVIREIIADYRAGRIPTVQAAIVARTVVLAGPAVVQPIREIITPTIHNTAAIIPARYARYASDIRHVGYPSRERPADVRAWLASVARLR